MAEKKLSRKELKAPDAFQKAGSEAWSWFREREGLVVGAIVVMLLIGAGAALASYVSGRGENKAAQAYSEALRLLSRPVSAAGVKPEGEQDEPPFASAKEKDEAVEKAFTEFRAHFKNSRSGTGAALVLGGAQLRLAKPDAALAAFDDYLKEAPRQEPLRASAYEGKGYAYEQKNDLNQALATYEAMSKENDTEFLAGMGNYHRARILVLKNKKEDAAAAFSEVSTRFPGSAAARLSSERLNELTAQGVKLPPAPAAAQGKDGG